MIPITEADGPQFLSTPSARRATPTTSGMMMTVRISIHALREEGDPLCRRSFSRFPNFYPRPPRGGRHPKGTDFSKVTAISIHALREEGDLAAMIDAGYIDISIHALREEGDIYMYGDIRIPGDFYPRPPRGGRPRPERGSRQRQRISIHALREEGDRRDYVDRVDAYQFLSTPSARRATTIFSHGVHGLEFLSTPSARRATGSGTVTASSGSTFLSTPSARRAT